VPLWCASGPIARRRIDLVCLEALWLQEWEWVLEDCHKRSCWKNPIRMSVPVPYRSDVYVCSKSFRLCLTVVYWLLECNKGPSWIENPEYVTIYIYICNPCVKCAQGNPYTANISDLLCIRIWFYNHAWFIHQSSLAITSRESNNEAGETWLVDVAYKVSPSYSYGPLIWCKILLRGHTALLHLRRKSCYGFVSPLNIHRPRPGLNQRILGPMPSTLPLDHRGRLYIYIYICIYNQCFSVT
jgi:hypothetical protein